MDESRLCEQLIGHYRDLMLTRAVQDPTPLLDTPSLDLQRLRAQSDRYSMERILYSIEVLQEALGRMSRSAERARTGSDADQALRPPAFHPDGRTAQPD